MVEMIKLLYGKSKNEPLKILCLGAHSDDIEIGCGGTILKLTGEYPNLNVVWVVFGASGVRIEEAQKSAELFLTGVGKKKILIKNFRDGYFPSQGTEIKDQFEDLKKSISPDIIFTHYRDDLHQDHRVIEELTLNTFRNHLILEYEIPKYDGDLGRPNFFVQLDEAIALRKIRYLLEAFPTQRNRYWFHEDTFRSLMQLRGIESRSPSKFSEGFYAYKVVL